MMESAPRYCSKLWLKNEEHADQIVKILKKVKAPEKRSGAFLFEKIGGAWHPYFYFTYFCSKINTLYFIIHEIF